MIVFPFFCRRLALCFINAWPLPGSERAPSLLQHVGTWRRGNRGVDCTAHRWGRHLFARAWLEPIQPVGPPTPVVLCGPGQPLVGVDRWLVVGPVALALGGWVDDASNMAAAAEDEAYGAVGKLRDAPGRLPGDDVVLFRANGIDVLADLAQVNRNAPEDNLARLDEVVLQVGVAQVEGVRRARHARAIGVPVEQVESWRLFPQQIVVDDVAPDEVVGAQHIEHGA